MHIAASGCLRGTCATAAKIQPDMKTPKARFSAEPQDWWTKCKNYASVTVCVCVYMVPADSIADLTCSQCIHCSLEGTAFSS